MMLCLNILARNFNTEYGLLVDTEYVFYYGGKMSYHKYFGVNSSECLLTSDFKIADEITPVFNQMGPFCQNGIAPPLPIVSVNGIKGAWSPAIIETNLLGAYIFTFTPDAGQNAIPVTMQINVIPQFDVSATIVADKVEIDDGETITFTAKPVNGGTSPVYAWFVNGGEIMGETSVTFSYKPQNYDIIYAVLTSDLTCTKNNPATSNEIIIKVNGAPVPVSVTIAVNQTEICEDEYVTFTATPVNGGANPIYAWYVNGVVVPGQTGVTYTYQPQHADVVFAILTSSLTEVTGNPSNSNEITIIVTDELAVSVSIISDKTEICDGETVTFTATPVNGGAYPIFAWFVNDTEVRGETSVIFKYAPQNGDNVYTNLTSDLGCILNNSFSSNQIFLNTSHNIPPEAFCQNIKVYLDENGKASIDVNQINKYSEGFCKIDTMYLSKYDFDCANVGINTLILTVIDSKGLHDSCVTQVTVLDTISPIVFCRGPFEIQLDENTEYKFTLAEVLESVEDNCKKIDTLYVFPHELDCDQIGVTTITLMAIDMYGNSSYCQSEVMIYGNSPPTVVNDSAFTIENVPVVIDIIENDYDQKTSLDISTLAVSIKPRYGTVSIHPLNGDLTYTPNKNFSGVDILQYRICDDGIPCEPNCGTAFVFISVLPDTVSPVAKLYEFNKLDCKIFPNPSNSFFNIEIYDIIESEIFVDVLNANGSLVKKYQFINSSGVLKQNINIDGMASGKYYIRVKSGKEVITKEIIIN